MLVLVDVCFKVVVFVIGCEVVYVFGQVGQVDWVVVYVGCVFWVQDGDVVFVEGCVGLYVEVMQVVGQYFQWE